MGGCVGDHTRYQGQEPGEQDRHQPLGDRNHYACPLPGYDANLPDGRYSALRWLTYSLPDSVDDSAMGDSLTDLRGTAASRAGLITHHSGQEPAEEEPHTKAEPLLIGGYGQMNPLPANANRKREALERIVKLYEAWDKPEQAAEWRAKPKANSDAARNKAAQAPDAP